VRKKASLFWEKKRGRQKTRKKTIWTWKICLGSVGDRRKHQRALKKPFNTKKFLLGEEN